MQTYVETLPALNMLRLCLRFGKGDFKKNLPIELIEKIAPYVAKPVREKVTKDFADACRCFRNTCSILDHADRDTLLRAYANFVGGAGTQHTESSDGDPSDEEIVDVLGSVKDTQLSEFFDEESAHRANEKAWSDTINKTFSDRNAAMFQKRFGLGIWLSFARLADNTFFDTHHAQTTITYLTFPNDNDMMIHEWPKDHGHEASYKEIGFGVAVGICKQPSAEELAKFSAVLKHLNLKVFVTSSQRHYPFLQAGSPMEDTDGTQTLNNRAYRRPRRPSEDKGKAVASLPRPRLTLLSRHFEDLVEE